ncbi:hypothetical protein ACFWOL_10705 [Streptomyces sp. NPDC058442]|uniref:hypothetical protein n=1 Tax=Streptomyces sp. NPDC058442 TaxID=3346503 RepID=UPI00365A0411
MRDLDDALGGDGEVRGDPGGDACGVDGIGAALTALSNAATAVPPPQRFASGTGLPMTSRQLGGALGIAALAAILERHTVLDDEGHSQVFLACAVGAAAAAVAALAIRSRSARHT